MKHSSETPRLVLKPELDSLLRKIKNRHSTSHRIRARIVLILAMLGGPIVFSVVAETYGVDRGTVRDWYGRIHALNEQWDQAVGVVLGQIGHAGDDLRIERLVLDTLSDRARCGAPDRYTHTEYVAIMNTAMSMPVAHGLPIPQWSARELTMVLHRDNLVPGISERQVARYLEDADIKPHKSRYWLNSKDKEENPKEYQKRVETIGELYMSAPSLLAQGTHVASSDEKTSIQALERIAPSIPMAPGQPERIESEYRRHGTLCLIPSFDVATGKIICAHIGPTRTEDDFTAHIKNTVSTDPQGRWVFVADQLNTHASESLVRLVAEIVGYGGDLGEKNRFGVLENLKSRKAFLEDSSHKVRFVYTPRHSSWLNQVEIWFSILSRKLLKRGSFCSIEDLKRKLEAFIEFFNQTMARPYKWTYKGKPLHA